jgi:hypothetical protein
LGVGPLNLLFYDEGWGWREVALNKQLTFHVVTRLSLSKNTSIAVCKRLFPDVSLLPSERCRKDHDGMAEALLMAEYARRRL